MRLDGLLPKRHERLTPSWVKRGNDLSIGDRSFRVKPIPAEQLINERIEITERAGDQPLWHGYQQGESATRTPAQVKTKPSHGRFYARLVQQLKAKTIVEFGTAFGVSGMYWLAGIESQGAGHLFTFEPNTVWRELAVRNLSAVSIRYTSIAGTFEANRDAALEGAVIDLAFIDAIHASEFVLPQFDLVVERAAAGAVIVLDDIAFSNDMRNCWTTLSNDIRVAESVSLSDRVGIIKLAST